VLLDGNEEGLQAHDGLMAIAMADRPPAAMAPARRSGLE